MSVRLRASELTLALSYRAPMLVRELMYFPDMRPPDSYYVCPRCQVTVEREFMRYCDRCGQCLDWSRYKRAKIVYPGRKKSETEAIGLGPTLKNCVLFLFNGSR